jgi:hypothetical protein
MSLGQALGPVQVIALSGGYTLVWVVAFVLVAFAAIAIIPVRKVR